MCRAASPTLEVCMDIRTTYDLTKSDIGSATAFYFANTAKLWRTIITPLYAGVGLLSLSIPHIRWCGVILMFGAVYHLVSPRLMALMMVRRYFSNPKLGRSIELHITDDNLDVNTELGSASHSWSLFKSWMESPQAFLLVIYKGYYIVVPKRAFEREDDLSVLRAFLQDTLGPAKA